MALTLYHSAYSTCSQKVRIALAEKKLSYISKEINFRKEEQLTPEYLAINPHGVVPTLIHDGNIITDSSCILEYLDDAFPETPLVSESPVKRAHMRAWLRFMEEVPTVAVRTPSFEQVFLPTLRLVSSKKSFEKSAQKRTIRKGFYGKMNAGKGFAESDIDNSMEQLASTVNRMEKALKTNHWIMGDKITLVDVSLAPLLDRMDDMGMAFLWRDAPNVDAWLKRIQARESFKEAFYKGSRLSQRLEFKLVMPKVRRKNKKVAEQLSTSESIV